MPSPAVNRLPRNTVAELLASYIERARDMPLPEAVSEVALMRIFDTVGAAAVGINEQVSVVCRELAQDFFRSGQVPVWFTGMSSSVIGAAWANSAAASALDLDDGDAVARGHIAAAVIPAAFAVAHETSATFEEILKAIAIGYQVGATIATARTAYGTTGTWVAYAVVATAGALRGSKKDVMAHALAIAGEAAPNCTLMSSPAPHDPLPEGSDVKEGIPWSVVAGLYALSAAEKGMTGPRNILDSIRHYRFPADLHEVLQSGWRIKCSYYKFYCCCRHIHGPLDALQDLMTKYQIQAQDIQKIEVETYQDATRLENRFEPESLPDIQYSIPYCLALIALAGPHALLPLTKEDLGRPEVADLARKILLSVSPDIEAVYPTQTLSRVIITCEKGTFTSGNTEPKGKGQDVTWEQLEAKFKTATRFVALPTQQKELVHAIREARAGNVSRMMTCFTAMRLV